MARIYILCATMVNLYSSLLKYSSVYSNGVLSSNIDHSLTFIPTFYKGLIEGQFAYEKLVVDAYFKQSYQKLLQALILIIDAHELGVLTSTTFMSNGGILAGLMAALVYNKLKDTKLPSMLAFFSGEKFPITVIIYVMIPIAGSGTNTRQTMDRG